MDFGDILDQWDNQQKNAARKAKENKSNQQSHKKANAPFIEGKVNKNASKPSVNPMELWLRCYGTVDKDRLMDQEEARNKYHSRSSLVEMRPEARIDLHGLQREEAWAKLEAFVTECEYKGIKKVMIVHGKGLHTHGSDPVLGELVRKFIEQDKRLGTSGHPDASGGGKGATWVILKNNLFK